MYVSVCSVLPPENWSDLLPNKGNSLLYLLTCARKTLLRASIIWNIYYVAWVDSQRGFRVFIYYLYSRVLFYG